MGISLPRNGLRFKELVQIANLPQQEFLAACPYPFLLQVPVQLQQAEDGEFNTTRPAEPEEILTLVRSRNRQDAAKALIHQLRPGGEAKTVVLGRDPAGAVEIDHKTVSSTHAEFSALGALWRIRDLGSSNGTFVDGQRLPPNVQSLIRDRSDVRFGTYQALFLLPATVHELITRMRGAKA